MYAPPRWPPGNFSVERLMEFLTRARAGRADHREADAQGEGRWR
jgi:hypothetical protein